MQVLEIIGKVFNFIYSLLDTIIDGVFGTIEIISSIIELIISITRILPNPLYPCFLTFLSLYGVIFTFKIFRKG